MVHDVAFFELPCTLVLSNVGWTTLLFLCNRPELTMFDEHDSRGGGGAHAGGLVVHLLWADEKLSYVSMWSIAPTSARATAVATRQQQHNAHRFFGEPMRS